jgi:hypothetical protein
MANIKKTVRNDDAKKYLALCEQGKLRVHVEFSDGGKIMTITNNDGVPQAVVGDRHKFMFGQFVELRGNGDGLFEGFHQTACRSTRDGKEER